MRSDAPYRYSKFEIDRATLNRSPGCSIENVERSSVYADGDNKLR